MQGATFVLVADATNTARREIRLALVLNGGVSLAIWIGGVVAEIDRARRAGLGPPAKADEIVDVYRELLDLTPYRLERFAAGAVFPETAIL